MAACLLCRREITICASCAMSMRGCDCALDGQDHGCDWRDHEPASPELLAALRTIDEMFER